MENARVLVVEDDPLWPELVEIVLEDTGHRIIGVCTNHAKAMEALDAAVRTPETSGFDAVVLDGNFPPSKMITGESARRVIEGLRERALGAIVIAFSTKPFTEYGLTPGDFIEMGRMNLDNLPVILNEL